MESYDLDDYIDYNAGKNTKEMGENENERVIRKPSIRNASAIMHNAFNPLTLVDTDTSSAKLQCHWNYSDYTSQR